MASELILIVEDNQRNLKLVRDLLQYQGYRTIEADNPADGLQLARSHQPSLILMDIQLPGMDGITALRYLRNDPMTADILVVALTAFAMKDDQTRFLDAGFNGYIAKPIDIKQFAQQIQACLHPAREGDEQ